MGGLLGANKPDTSAIKAQEEAAAKAEREQAAQLAAKRRASAGGNRSKTLFSAVLGTDEAIGKQTKLGG